MDSVDLLAREEQFKKLNKQLEKRSCSLMKQIDTVMAKPDFFAEISSNILLNPQGSNYASSITTTSLLSSRTKPASKSSPRVGQITMEKIQIPKPVLIERPKSSMVISKEVEKARCHCSSNDYTNTMEFLYAFVSVNVEMNVIPASFLKDNLNVESVCKFLASKVKLMQEQLQKLQATINKKVCQCEAHLMQLADQENTRLQLLNKINNLSAESSDSKAKVMTLKNRLAEKERLYKELRSQTDKLNSEAKKLRTVEAKAEAKFITQEEEIERLKCLNESLKNADKELRTSTRHLTSTYTNTIARLENKMKLLTSTIDKQKALIENLREQNSVLSVAQGLKRHEKDYLEFLTNN